MRYRSITLSFLALFCASAAERVSRSYALILQDAPLAQRGAFETEAATAARGRRIETEQAQLKATLAQRKFTMTGAVQQLLDAVFVQATPDRVPELKALPGVTAVVPLHRYHLSLNAAVGLMNGPAAWTALGGVNNAGRGMKIAIIDTGIDQNHPAFRDSTLTAPAGFPVCSGFSGDCHAFTNNKVIVARSYVKLDAAGSDPTNPAVDSRADDYSPRDRIGHGTAVASVAAGNTNTGPGATTQGTGVTITGMAPHAFLGSYKVFGSSGLNDGASGDAIIQAAEDALKDGMNVAVLSLGGPAFSGPLDTGAACGLDSPNAPCDPEAVALENAVHAGMVVVAAGGNEGLDGQSSGSTLNTADSPGYAPSVIAAGASTNAHIWLASVQVPGSDAPSNLQVIGAQFGDGPLPAAPVTAPLRDVEKIGGSALGCTALPSGSLTGTFALIERGTCNFSVKVQNAQDAGAVGVILYLASAAALFPPGGLTNTMIPAVLIGNSDGLALKDFVGSHPDHLVTIDPNPFEDKADATPNAIADFSSRGPSTGIAGIKPDLVAVGTDMYMAAQSLDPQGELYSANGYTVADGTSFSTPLTAGAAALVKQKNPGWSATQIKSALVNNASHDISGAVTVLDVGGGKLDAGAAIAATVTAEPATLSFGVLNNATLPLSQTVKLTNLGTASANLSISVVARIQDANASVKVNPSSVQLGAGQSANVTITLSGQQPKPGEYDGSISVSGSGTNLSIPYLYLDGDGVPADMIDLTGGATLEGTVGQPLPADQGGFAFKIIDKYGVPVASVPVQWSAGRNGGQIQNPDAQTDSNGIAGANAVLGPQTGTQRYTASAGGFSIAFQALARKAPVISNNGVVNAASYSPTNAIVPGSYIAIFGTALSDTTDQAQSGVLPPSIDEVAVSFDVPSAGISAPGYIYYVSSGQINLQVPWELQGQTSALMKVRVGESVSAVMTVPIASYSPAFFEYQEQGSSVLFADARDLNFALIGTPNPAKRGQVIQLYVNGLGPVSNQPDSGIPAAAQALARTSTTPTVTIGGKAATVGFSGLVPGISGLYQLNVTVPPDSPTGVQPVTVSIGGMTSKTSNIPVQ